MSDTILIKKGKNKYSQKKFGNQIGITSCWIKRIIDSTVKSKTEAIIVFFRDIIDSEMQEFNRI